MSGTKGSDTISTKQHKIAKLASKEPGWTLTTLAHHIDLEWMYEAYRRTRKKGAVGVDGVSAREYERRLEENLSNLLDRFKSGVYRAPAVRRVYIEKEGSGSTRPIGIPTLEDKVLQRAVLMVLEPLYEQDFLDCSYGFRPRRSAHDALESLWKGLMRLKGGWVIDLDIRQFFDNVSRADLSDILDQRVRDGVIRRVLGKWMQAGVMEEGVLWYPEKGTPQGGVISPLISNIFLHEVLDKWFEDTAKPRLSGHAMMVRFADDAVLCFERKKDAKRVMDVLAKRFERFGLELNAEKTKMVRFAPPNDSENDPGEEPENGNCFDFLSFTHFWARSKNGRWIVRRKTAKNRFGRSLKRVADWCRINRHLPVREQHVALNRKLVGHYNYFGITGNSRALSRFRRQVERVWRNWLDRRSNNAHMSWERFGKLLNHYPLAPPRVVRSVYRPAANP